MIFIIEAIKQILHKDPPSITIVVIPLQNVTVKPYFIRAKDINQSFFNRGKLIFVVNMKKGATNGSPLNNITILL